MSYPRHPTMKPVTGQQIAQLILSRMEPDEPINSLMAVLRELNGKRLDKRNLAKIEAAVPGVRKVMIAGMTELKWGGDNDGGTLLLAHDLGAVPINVDYIIAHNPAYFGARLERNAKRAVVAADVQWLAELAKAINDFQKAHANLVKYLQRPELDPDQSSIEALAGLRCAEDNNRIADLTAPPVLDSGD